MAVLCTIEFNIPPPPKKKLRSAHSVYLCVLYGSQRKQWLFPYTLADGLQSRLCVTFYILLTVHLVMILGKWPTWRTILFYVFISTLYTFRANTCSLSGESTVSIQHLVYVTLCRWPFRVQVRKDLHTKRSPTQSDIYQMLYWYSWFSW